MEMENMADFARPDPFQSDKRAIKDLLRVEFLAFQTRDYDTWQACYVQDERTTDVMASPLAGVSVVRGWPQVSAHIKQVLAAGPFCQAQEFSQENFQIEVMGDLASAVYETWSITRSNIRQKALDVRILERAGGAWKILFSSFVLQEIGTTDRATVEIDGVGRIKSVGPEALDLLKSHPTLTLSGDRLRGRRRAWNAALMKAIRSAAQHHGFFQTYDLTHEMGLPARYPVILGTTDDGGVALVYFTIRDCCTFVHLDATDGTARRLAAASAVFGLSQGQTRVAQGIVSGHGLKKVAEDLGISVNTARTHLARLYDKTGVNSQPALVRVLMSVG